MPVLWVTGHDGHASAVEGEAGLSVMEVIRDAGIDGMLALCGGCCSCATCHVHVDDGWLDRLPPMGAAENELLDSAVGRDTTSRLSCQLPFGSDLDGLPVRIGGEG